MPSSYRDADERADDKLAYFDYGERPPREASWRGVILGSASWSAIAFVWALLEEQSAIVALVVAGIALPLGAAVGWLGPWIRSRHRGDVVVGRRSPYALSQGSRSSIVVPRPISLSRETSPP